MSPKRAARRAKFRKIGAAISALKQVKIGDPDVPDYHTGLPSRFHRRNDSSDEVNEIHGVGPVFQTPQWIRTVKRSDDKSQ